MAIKRSSDILTISRWYSGEFTNRNPLVTPIAVQGMHVIERYDTLIDGLNMEVSPRNTMERRPGFTQQCSVAVSAPLGFYSFRNLSGTINALVDSNAKVQTFTSSTLTDLFTKSGGAGQARFETVGNWLYIVDGVDLYKWDGTHLWKMGIVAPANAPTVAVTYAPGAAPGTQISATSPIPGGQSQYSVAGADTWQYDGYNEWRIITGGTSPTQPLLITFSGISIPTGQIATGLAMSFAGATQAGASSQSSLNALGVWDGTSSILGTPKNDTALWPKGNYKTYSYGSITDLFGVTPATIQTQLATGAITFALKAIAANLHSFVSQFSLIIYVTTPGTWQPGTNYALGAAVVDSNNNTQVCTTAGTSVNPGPPTWNVTVGGTTGDGTVVWTNYGAISGSGPTAPPSLSPQSGYTWVYVFRNSVVPHVSTASPISANSGTGSGMSFTIAGVGSGDAQVDTIQLYRTKDGGSVYYLVTTLSNPGAGNPWTYVDTTADANLNVQIVAPIADANDPPPSTGNNLCFHSNRLWMSYKNYVAFSGGPDTTNGNGMEAWPPANVFTFPGLVTGLAPTGIGLLVFTVGNTYIIRGLDSSSYYSRKFISNFGVFSQNDIAQDGDLTFIFTSARQLFNIQGTQLEEVGFEIANQLASVDPTAARLQLHRAGVDSGLFITDGSTSFWRYTISKQVWSTKSAPVGSLTAIGSIQTSDGVQRLLVGLGASTTDLLNGAAGNLPNPPWSTGPTLNDIHYASQGVIDGTVGFQWNVAYNNQTTFSNDHSSQIVVAANGGAPHGNGSGPCVRVNSSFNTFYVAAAGQNYIKLQAVVSGTTTTLATYSVTPVAGDVIKLTVQGTNLTVYYNGAKVLTASDSTVTIGAPGFAVYSDVGSVQLQGPWLSYDLTTMQILYRDITNWKDNGSTYSCYATVGSIVMASLGTIAPVESILLERAAVGTDATISVLPNEISGTFVAIPNPVQEPPQLPASTSVIAKRHYLKNNQSQMPQMFHHIQIKVAFASENAHSEILTLAISPPQG